LAQRAYQAFNVFRKMPGALRNPARIENGYRVKVAETGLETHVIDTPEGLGNYLNEINLY